MNYMFTKLDMITYYSCNSDSDSFDFWPYSLQVKKDQTHCKIDISKIIFNAKYH